MSKIAIIGAGLSGLVAASRLNKNAEIEIFEKSRGVGGRMNSRRFCFDNFPKSPNFTIDEKAIEDLQKNSPNVLSQNCHDYGAQFFNAKSKEFQDFLQPFIEQKFLAKWLGNFVEIDGNKIAHQRFWDGKIAHYVAIPQMNQIAKILAENQKIHLQTRISRIEFIDQKWRIFNDNQENLGEFGFLIIAIPPEQALEILPKNFKFVSEITARKMLGCFAVMLGLAEELPVEWDVAYVKNSKLSWIAKEGSKPHRKGSKALTFLSRNAWAQRNLERNLFEVKEELIAELNYATNFLLPKILYSDIHRWRYANIDKQVEGEPFLLDEENRIGICGDWLIRGRIEAAFTSGNKLAAKIAEILT